MPYSSQFLNICYFYHFPDKYKIFEYLYTFIFTLNYAIFHIYFKSLITLLIAQSVKNLPEMQETWV